jgi:hypothetical protein
MKMNVGTGAQGRLRGVGFRSDIETLGNTANRQPFLQRKQKVDYSASKFSTFFIAFFQLTCCSTIKPSRASITILGVCCVFR